MKLSEALQALYIGKYGELDQPAVDQAFKAMYFVAAQVPSQSDDLLKSWMFEMPANVLAVDKKDPKEAKVMLLRAIGGVKAWEEVGAIEDSGPTKEDWDKFLNDNGILDIFKS
jgi:hypothetical protein